MDVHRAGPKSQGSDGQSSSRSSVSSPAKAKAYNTYKDLKNVWAPNAQSWREQSATRSCIQLSLFLLALGALLTLVIVNFWAEQKLTWAQTLLEPRLTTVTVTESCQAPEDLIDYAALVNGGAVLPESSSPSYHGSLLVRLTQETLGGFNKLDYLIDRDNSRAHCWAFDGRQGHATIKLGRPILNYVNAPRHFAIYSLGEDECHLLGFYTFAFDLLSDVRETTQYFPCRSYCSEPISTLRLEIEDNYGDPNVTCVYQLRVHGLPV